MFFCTGALTLLLPGCPVHKLHVYAAVVCDVGQCEPHAVVCGQGSVVGPVREAESSPCGIDESTGQCTPGDTCAGQPLVTGHRNSVSQLAVILLHVSWDYMIPVEKGETCLALVMYMCSLLLRAGKATRTLYTRSYSGLNGFLMYTHSLLHACIYVFLRVIQCRTYIIMMGAPLAKYCQ